MANTNNVIHPLSMYYQNVRGLRTKCVQLYNNILSHDYDLILLTETWLQSDIMNSEICDSRYDIFRCDRNLAMTHKSTGGGVMICVRSELGATLTNGWSCASCESVCVTIPARALHSSVDLHIAIVYVPPVPSRLSDRLEDIKRSISECIDLLPSNNYLILGDFNLPQLEWDAEEQLARADGTAMAQNLAITFVDELGYLGFSQYNYNVNSKNNILDLCFSTLPLNVAVSHSPLIKEDVYHPALCIDILDIKLKPFQELRHSRFNFNKCDYTKINTYLKQIDWEIFFFNCNDINKAVEAFYDELHKCFILYVPLSSHSNIQNCYPIWYSSALIKIILEKSRMHRKWKRYGNPRDYDEFSLLRARQRRIQTQCFESFTKNTEKIIRHSPKYFWRYVKAKKGGSSYPKNFTLGNSKYDNGQSICEAFNEFFDSVFIRSSSNINYSYSSANQDFSYHATDCLSSINVTEDVVMNFLKTLDKSKGAGCDGIPPVLLSSCAESLASPITILFRRSLKECIFPDLWKIAHIIPVHKKGSRSAIENYRPISILSTISKVFEKIVYNVIYPIIVNGIPDSQHGFLRGRSTVSNLSLFSDFVLCNMERGGQVDVVYTDFEKAFDRVDHDLLLQKLCSLGIHGDLLRWVRSYLSNRCQAVVLGGYKSDYINIPSGVPQGSHLGPLLYNAYIFDISNCFSYASHLLYADDKKIFIKVHSVNDCELLQQDLNKLFDYYVQNRITVSIGKCQTISFTRKSNPIMFPYHFNNVSIVRVDKVRDLGVYFDSKMLLTTHYDKIIDRSYRNLGFVLRTCQPFKSPLSLKVVYYAYVRSILEYASPVWSPSYAIHKTRMERIQKKFLKHLNFKCFTSLENYIYKENCHLHNLLTLEERRIMLDMCLLYDILNGRLDCPDLLSSISLKAPTRRTRQTSLFHVPFHYTNYGKNAVLTRILRCYNDTFSDIDPFIITSKQALKSKIIQVLLDLNV